MSSIAPPEIVVGVDGSPAAKVAVDWAARDAARRGASLALVHVVNSVLGSLSQTPLPTGIGNWQKERAHQAVDDAIGVVAAVQRETGPLEARTEIYYSAAVPTLVDMSKGAGMVVVGSRRHGAIGSLLGSVSAGVVQHAHCPVAVIHDEDPLMPHPAQAPVLVGIDGSPASELATAIAFEEASLRRVDLIALHAWTEFGVGDFLGMNWLEMKSSEDAALAQRLAGWQENYPDVQVRRLVICDHPARVLVEHSEEAQLVVVGSHGRGGFAGMLLGSVSAAVVQSARMPVIVARQP
ncbi:universal stress protein UspA-like protein [Mycolicibacterium rhodesiae NBB3]|uniref:Universal stress protein UspA-like protein n=1 Tax=Mycolicibacterium rhodesiae (strain NBB3) TaxID=710685 RepID=G8RXZ2_MYCRN|nr:universal stress protein [Mycolicibacterium rhodesiae]AEV70685.1 universal stress protein UspA-like protein [Mycolicibacterium rhodesiae NBB3]